MPRERTLIGVYTCSCVGETKEIQQTSTHMIFAMLDRETSQTKIANLACPRCQDEYEVIVIKKAKNHVVATEREAVAADEARKRAEERKT